MLLARLAVRPPAARPQALRRLFRSFSDAQARLDRLIHNLETSTGTPANRAAQVQPAAASSSPQPANTPAAPDRHAQSARPAATETAPRESEAWPPMQLFALAEIVVGELAEVAALPGSDKLYTERVDIGWTRRSVASGLRPHVPIEGMAGKVLLFANLKPRKLAGYLSEGMLLCSSLPAEDGAPRVELCRPAEDAQLGERVYPEGSEPGLAAPGLAPMKPDLLKRLLDQLATDGQGCLVFAGVRLRTRSGYLKASSLQNAKVS